MQGGGDSRTQRAVSEPVLAQSPTALLTFQQWALVLLHLQMRGPGSGKLGNLGVAVSVGGLGLAPVF